MPPVGTAFAAPVMALIQPTHGRCHAIGRGTVFRGKQLGQPLVRKAIETDPTIAVWVVPNPIQGCGCVFGFLTESLKNSPRVSLPAHVLH